MHSIVKYMLLYAWIPIINHRLNFGKQDQMQAFISRIFSENLTEQHYMSLIEIESLIDEFLCKNPSIYTTLLRYVPYRFLSPFYEGKLDQIPESSKNCFIVKLSLAEPLLYSFDGQNNIIIPDKWYQYLYDNCAILEGWIKYKLVQFLQRRNPNIPSISQKLALHSRESLTSQRILWIEFMRMNGTILDYVSRQPVVVENFQLDHFIPWSFVLHNQIWNLIPLSQNSNLKKSDSLPDLDDSLEIFIETQFEFHQWLNKHPERQTLGEYSYVFKNEMPYSKTEFISELERTITPLWFQAASLGYPVYK